MVMLQPYIKQDNVEVRRRVEEAQAEQTDYAKK